MNTDPYPPTEWHPKAGVLDFCERMWQAWGTLFPQVGEWISDLPVEGGGSMSGRIELAGFDRHGPWVQISGDQFYLGRPRQPCGGIGAR
jgi:hypothetical protein